MLTFREGPCICYVRVAESGKIKGVRFPSHPDMSFRALAAVGYMQRGGCICVRTANILKSGAVNMSSNRNDPDWLIVCNVNKYYRKRRARQQMEGE